MQPHFHHPTTSVLHHDMTLSCTMLFVANNLMSFLCHITAMQWLQGAALAGSLVASCYITYNQHLSAKWKRKQDKLDRDNHKNQNHDH